MHPKCIWSPAVYQNYCMCRASDAMIQGKRDAATWKCCGNAAAVRGRGLDHEHSRQQVRCVPRQFAYHGSLAVWPPVSVRGLCNARAVAVPNVPPACREYEAHLWMIVVKSKMEGERVEMAEGLAPCGVWVELVNCSNAQVRRRRPCIAFPPRFYIFRVCAGAVGAL